MSCVLYTSPNIPNSPVATNVANAYLTMEDLSFHFNAEDGSLCWNKNCLRESEKIISKDMASGGVIGSVCGLGYGIVTKNPLFASSLLGGVYGAICGFWWGHFGGNLLCKRFKGFRRNNKGIR